MRLNIPLVVGGKIFPEAALSLAISPLYRPNFLSATAVLTLVPIRREENGNFEVMQEAQHHKSLVFPDIFVANDPDILICVGKVQAAIQELLDKKGI